MMRLRHGLPDQHRHSALHPADQPWPAVAAAKTILDANIMGAMCARVCPTENLCEGACVKETSETRAVEIGRLQRYATDAAFAAGSSSTRQAHPRAKRSR